MAKPVNPQQSVKMAKSNVVTVPPDRNLPVQEQVKDAKVKIIESEQAKGQGSIKKGDDGTPLQIDSNPAAMKESKTQFETDENGDVVSESQELPTWTCKVEGQPKEAQWTVGEVFHLECEGTSVNFSSVKLQFKHKERQDYALKILEVEKQTSNSLFLKVTSYNAGAHQFDQSSLLDDSVPVLKIEPFKVAVQTVIRDPQQKPFGPAAPFKLSYPAWLWVMLGVVLLGGLFLSLFRLKRRAQMRKVLEELKQHNTALGAFNQFNKDIRSLGRQYIFGKSEGWPEQKRERYIESLDSVFRMYLLREFYVPALDWGSGLVVRTISKQDKKRFPIYGDELRKFLKEIDRAKNDSDKIQMHDCKQLTQMAKKVSQSIWKVRKN
ncbi:MAG: hypothetical protein AAF203_04490 [Pseudomonadota bacterium]